VSGPEEQTQLGFRRPGSPLAPSERDEVCRVLSDILRHVRPTDAVNREALRQAQLLLGKLEAKR